VFITATLHCTLRPVFSFTRIYLNTLFFYTSANRRYPEEQMILNCLIRPIALFLCYSPHWARVSSFTKCLYHTKRRITFGRTPLDERSARCRDLYLTTHNTHNRQTSMSPVGFEPTISEGERTQTSVLDRVVVGIGPGFILPNYNLDCL